MATVVFVDDDFRRMPRADMARLQRLIDAGKFGTHRVPFKDREINVEIKKQGDKVTVRISRTS
ncbi:hypothetical protein [Methanoregula sp.]|uniref:hypothetical protein n=1 Tax=Methanoregula sp. TaxID=2052170 RepID=UPI002B56FA6A|nr:hypothetical protein [Methanoregula sp.]HVP97260.1 hypothetical protein [Methanoregula sp.]